MLPSVARVGAEPRWGRGDTGLGLSMAARGQAALSPTQRSPKFLKTVFLSPPQNFLFPPAPPVAPPTTTCNSEKTPVLYNASRTRWAELTAQAPRLTAPQRAEGISHFPTSPFPSAWPGPHPLPNREPPTETLSRLPFQLLFPGSWSRAVVYFFRDECRLCRWALPHFVLTSLETQLSSFNDRSPSSFA